MNETEFLMIRDIIREIIENADKTKAEMDKSKDLFLEGKMLAYTEVIDIIQSCMIPYELPELDFDSDIKYYGKGYSDKHNT